jgi:hypothetical protein
MCAAIASEYEGTPPGDGYISKLAATGTTDEVRVNSNSCSQQRDKREGKQGQGHCACVAWVGTYVAWAGTYVYPPRLQARNEPIDAH